MSDPLLAPVTPDRLSTVGSAPRWLMWNLLWALAFVSSVSGLLLGAAVWDLAPAVQVFVGGVAGAHLLGAGLFWWTASREVRIAGFAGALASVCIAYGLLSGAILALRAPYYSVAIMAAGAVTTAVLLFGMPRLTPARRELAMLGSGIVALTVIAAASGSALEESAPDDKTSATVGAEGFLPASSTSVDVRSALTGFYRVRVSVHRGLVPTQATGGALEPYAGGYLVASADGPLAFVTEASRGGAMTARLLRGAVPMARAALIAYGATAVRSGRLEPGAMERQDLRNFRVMDVMLRPTAQGQRIYVSHHYWKRDDDCFVVRVSVADLTPAILAGTDAFAWRTLYDTKPCLPLDMSVNFEEAGGRMSPLADGRFILAVGDQRMRSLEIVQDFRTDYGKTIVLRADAGAVEVFTVGHRNPQGLFLDSEGLFWETEHGPQGGDELNRLTRHANYGWPTTTYGTEYGRLDWPSNPNQGRQEGFTEPVFAWLPAIGVSNVLRVRGDAFELWRGDLLVSSLAARTLFRLRVGDDNAIKYVEPIYVRERIRDLVETEDGRIVMLLDGGAIGVVERTEARSSLVPTTALQEAAFEECRGCHAVGAGRDHRSGPDLWGVLGRDIASADGFEYSASLRSVPGRWTRDNLSRFLQNPQAFAANTTMPSPGIADPVEIAPIVEFLAAQHDAPSRTEVGH